MIDNLDQPALDRIHRFVRLWRKLGWTMEEVDRSINRLKQGVIDNDLISMLAGVRRLSAKLDRPEADILSLYAPVDTYAYKDDIEVEKPLYDRLFLDPAVIRLNPGDVDPFALGTTDGA